MSGTWDSTNCDHDYSFIENVTDEWFCCRHMAEQILSDSEPDLAYEPTPSVGEVMRWLSQDLTIELAGGGIVEYQADALAGVVETDEERTAQAEERARENGGVWTQTCDADGCDVPLMQYVTSDEQ